MARPLTSLTRCKSPGPRATTLTPVTHAFITGADGFVGPYLQRHLVSCGDTVSGSGQTTGPDLLDGDGWIELFTKEKPDVVYHLAGWSDVGGSWDNPHTTLRVNAEGTMSVLEAARRSDVQRVIVVSSSDVYGIVEENELPLTEASPSRPTTPYAASKLAAEAVAAQYQRGWGLDVVVARPFNHIGPGQSPRFVTAAFAERIARCELEGGGVVSHGDLSPRRDLNDVRDVVAAYRLLATNGEAGHTYNICSGNAVAMADVLTTLIDQATVEISTEINPDFLRPIDLPVLQGSHQKLTSHTGWEPAISLSESLGDVLEAARQALSTNGRTSKESRTS